MTSFSDFIDRIFLQDGLLEKLLPTEPLSYDLLLRIRAADDAALSGGRAVGHAENFALNRGGLLYAVDAIDEAHAIFQEGQGDLAAYWHGMMHRREGDFENARHWYRRAGALPCFAELHRAAGQFSADMSRQENWDPYLLTGACEQARFGAEEGAAELAKLQRAEFEGIFGYTWRQSAVR